MREKEKNRRYILDGLRRRKATVHFVKKIGDRELI